MQLGRRSDRFADRAAAGAALAAPVTRWLAEHGADPGAVEAGAAPVLVLALPRGGVPVAVPVARAARAPLDVLLVRKIGVPGQPELAMGALAVVAGAAGAPGAGVEVVRNEAVLDRLRIPAAAFADVLARERTELDRRMAAYRGDRPPPVIRGRAVVVVDDGLATGSTMRAAVAAVRRREPARVLVAVPIGAADTCARLRGSPDVDDVVCVRCPEPFGSVGQGYRDFGPTSDDEVRAGLAYDLRG